MLHLRTKITFETLGLTKEQPHSHCIIYSHKFNVKNDWFDWLIHKMITWKECPTDDMIVNHHFFKAKTWNPIEWQEGAQHESHHHRLQKWRKWMWTNAFGVSDWAESPEMKLSCLTDGWTKWNFRFLVRSTKFSCCRVGVLATGAASYPLPQCAWKKPSLHHFSLPCVTAKFNSTTVDTGIIRWRLSTRTNVRNEVFSIVCTYILVLSE